MNVDASHHAGTPEPLAVHRETLAGEVLEIDYAIHRVALQHSLIGMHRVDMQAFVGAAVALFPSETLDDLKHLDGTVVQLGGKSTTGKGLCRVKLS